MNEQKHRTKKYDKYSSDGFSEDGFGKNKTYKKVTYIPELKELLIDVIQQKYDNILAKKLPAGLYCVENGKGQPEDWFLEKFNISKYEKWFIIGRFEGFSDDDWCALKRELCQNDVNINCSNPHYNIQLRIQLGSK